MADADVLKSVKEARNAFHKEAHLRTDAERRFITEDTIESIVTEDLMQNIFKGCEWVGFPEIRQGVRAKYSKVISILIWIGWKDWKLFEKHFMEPPHGHLHITNKDPSVNLEHADINLPFKWDDPSKSVMFGRDDWRKAFNSIMVAVRKFNEEQYVFIPIVIVDSQLQDYSSEPKRRLPFLDSAGTGTILGSGAFGVVKKEIIAYKQFQSNNERHLKTETIAVKLITRKSGPGATCDQCRQHLFCSRCEGTQGHSRRTPDYLASTSYLGRMQSGVFSGPQRNRESNVLQQLKDSLWTHGRVMKNLGALVHGRNFYILYPVAEMDLQKFLGGLYDSFDNEAFKLHRVDVIEQTRDLAGALVFLHTGMRDREGQKIACYHMDLKPDNILIQNFSSADHPVGVWKISDFGLSTVVQLAKTDNKYQITDDNKLASVTDVINHYSSGAVTEARNAGPSAFQPPPSKYVSQLDRYLKSDVWSFGCIFSIILNYLLGGVDKVDQFNCNRYLELDKLKSAENDFFYRPNENGRMERSPEVNRWLDALKDEYRGRWISKSVELIRETLEIEPSKRPTSDTVHRMLVDIKMSLKDNSMDPLPETAEHTPDPAVGSSGPTIPIVLRPTLVLERETIGEDQKFASYDHKDSEVSHLARGTRNTFKYSLPENASLSSLVSSPVIPVNGINTMSDEVNPSSRTKFPVNSRVYSREPMASGSFKPNAPPSPSTFEAQKHIQSSHIYMPAGMPTPREQSEPAYTQYRSSDSPPVSEDGNSMLGGNRNQLRTKTSPVIIQPNREPEDALGLYHQDDVTNPTIGVTSPHEYNDNMSFGTASSTAQPPDHLPQRVFFEDVKKSKVIRTALCPSGRTVAFLTKEAVLVALISGLEAESEVTINEELSKLDLEGTGWNRVVIGKEKILVIGNIKDGKTILTLCYMPEGLRQGAKIARQPCYEFMNVARTEMSSQGILLLQKSDSIETGLNLDMLSPMPGLENLKKQDHHIKDVSFSNNGEVVVAVVGTKNPGWYCWKRISGRSWAAPQFGYLSGGSASLSNMMLTPFSRHDGFMASGTAPGYKVSLLVKEEKAKYRRENVGGLSSSILRAYIGPRDKAIFAITSPMKRLGTSSEIWEAKMSVSGDGQKQICGKAAFLTKTCRGLYENEDVVIVDSDEGRFIWIAYNNGSLQKIPFGS